MISEPKTRAITLAVETVIFRHELEYLAEQVARSQAPAFIKPWLFTAGSTGIAARYTARVRALSQARSQPPAAAKVIHINRRP